MKKHILIGAALLSLMAASCSNDDVIDNGTEVVTGKTITLNATINNGDTRLTYGDDGSSKITVGWSNSESFTMYKGTNGTGSTFINTADATGTFKGNDIDGDGKYYAVYGDNISNTDGTLSIDLSGAQVGTSEENGIKEFMLATADALSSTTTLTFNHKLTVLKMTLTLPSDVTGTVSKVTVRGLHNKASYSLSDGSYTYADDNKGDITATNGTTGFEIKATGDGDTKTKSILAYVAVFPEKILPNQVKITAFVDDNDYSYTIALNESVSDLQLQENQVVPVKVTLVPKTNFKSAYIKEDYKTWSNENCKSAPTYDEMKMYLGAGVYWDNGDEGDNQQTYTLPDGGTYHAGLWLMKKAYIDGFSKGTATKSTNVTTKSGRPTEINKYFFLPAAGRYIISSFYGAGSSGLYWSSSPYDNDYAYCLDFSYSNAGVNNSSRPIGYLPMVSE